MTPRAPSIRVWTGGLATVALLAVLGVAGCGSPPPAGEQPPAEPAPEASGPAISEQDFETGQAEGWQPEGDAAQQQEEQSPPQ